MLVLRRTVRFALSPLHSEGDTFDGRDEPRHNPYSSWPAIETARGLGVYSEIDVEVRGTPDPVSGYLVNITALDALVRREAIPWLTRAFADQYVRAAPLDPAKATREIARRLAQGQWRPPDAGRQPMELSAVTWRLSACLRYRYDFAMPTHVEIRQQFEFSAAHRLHCPSLDQQQNQSTFGKCNNPNGHGHNYRLEVGVAVPVDLPPGSPRFSVGTFDRVVDETVLRRLDHRHLNLDVPEFADLNPSVEHIAKVCHDLLAPALAAHGASITTVTVWETEKTSCTYPAPIRVT
jgi:6-pyruvoyltetrahydropterin/6-carboxytetrahydropterin synthase